MKTFLNPSKIPADMPIPRATVPFELTKSISRTDLEAIGWEDLNIVPWLRWLVEQSDDKSCRPDNDLTKSLSFASALLPVLSKQWEGLSQSSKATVTELMTSRTTIPTKIGLRRPADSYFPSVKLFEDLPTIVGLHSVKDKMLVAFGVRKTVDIGVVFARLMDSSKSEQQAQEDRTNNWSHVDLIKYLASVRQDIPPGDVERLTNTAICPAESDPSPNGQAKRYLVSQLFEPDDALRRLGLPILQWPGVYRSGTPEGKLLTSLGLKSCPTYAELIDIMASAGTSSDLRLRDQALGYLINHFQLKGYSKFDTAGVVQPYLPIQGSEKRLQIPRQCFINERNTLLGFDILRRDLHPHAAKFGVQINPSISECVDRLIKNPPSSHRSAREIFAYFASRLTELDNDNVTRIGEAAIVPLKKTTNIEKPELSKNVRHVAPTMSFLGTVDKVAEIFDYIDFSQYANVFLLKCGSKHEPSTSELAAKVIREPARVFTALEHTRYLELLRNLADAWSTLKKNKSLAKEMKTASFLLGYREIASKTMQRSSAVLGDHQVDDLSLNSMLDEDDDTVVRVPELASADKITVINDMITYGQFRDHLLAAPMEEVLEEFYVNLGSFELGDIVEQQHDIGQPLKDQSRVTGLHKLIVERTRLYLHDQNSETISHDAKWIEKNLSIKFVRSISLLKSLRGTRLRRSQAKSATVSYNRQEGFVLSVTAGFDFFEVAQGLIGLLLKKPKTQQSMMLEMLLETDLHKLKTKGYNIERILRQKANEARMAEENRRKLLEQEQQELKQREAAWKESEAQKAREHNRALMPGDFPSSPQTKYPAQVNQPTPQVAEPNQQPRGFFAKIGRSLGIDDRKGLPQDKFVDRSLTNTPNDAPPPYSQQDVVKRPQTPRPQPETVTASHRLQQK